MGRACIESVRESLIDSGGVFGFVSLSFSCPFCFGFEIFFAILLGLPLFMSFVGLAVFPDAKRPF
jgi:hypothetical protein